MKITVAIPCYNLEDRIAICLDSVVSQDYNDIEILVTMTTVLIIVWIL